jgi:hypothetical protein
MKQHGRFVGGLLVCVFMLVTRHAFAHNPDTSYARVAIADNQIEVRLTLDLFTLQKIRPVDADGDQLVTRAELDAAAPEVVKFLRDFVRLEIDGQLVNIGESSPASMPSGTGDSIAAADWHTANGLVTFTFHHLLTKPAHDVALLFDFFDTVGTRHTVLGAFEYRGRTEEVTFTETEPDYLFDTAYAAGENALPPSSNSQPSIMGSVGRFIKLGVEHIFLGYDHICFLLALLVVSRFREMLKIITSFTVAHSITLIVAGLGIARLPSRLVECGIALTIIYVAFDNLRRKSTAHRWLLTFGFGLVHGFGFASVLSELGLPAVGRVRCLLAFNIGVEIGQLAIVSVALPILWLLAKRQLQARVAFAVSVIVGLFGMGWFIERAFGLGFMPV